MFNTTAFGAPIPGAPAPLRTQDPFSDGYVLTCECCHGLINNPKLREDYWQKLHEAWVDYEKRRRENNSRLNGDKDYFTGA